MQASGLMAGNDKTARTAGMARTTSRAIRGIPNTAAATKADCSKLRCFTHSQGLARRKNNLPVGGVMVMLLVPFAVEMV
jgi:hypothetical protein